jgi:hypothetical protein
MKTNKAFWIMALVLGLVLVGGLAAQTSDSPLVLRNGEAWVNTKANLRSGYIFQPDGKYLSINNYDGEAIGQWTIVGSGTWTVNGNSLALTSDKSGAIRDCTFTLSDNTFMLSFWGDEETYTKTSVANLSTSVYGQ